MITHAKPSPHDYAAWTLAALAMLFVLKFYLLPALIAGLLVYELVHVLSPCLAPHLSSGRAKGVVIGLIVCLVLGALAASIFGVVAFTRSESGSFTVLLGKIAEILEHSRATLPAWLADWLPDNPDNIGETIATWLREHASELQLIGKETGHMLAHLLFGIVIGAIVSLHEACDTPSGGPLARALTERAFRLSEAFRRIVFAQVRISAINTAFTGLYLAVVLPLCDVHLPLVKTMIVATFILGLLPVIGNLLSNTVIVTVSLAHSPLVALASLAFLVVIHKLEYFLNARIVGAQIRARVWELLTAMLVMESAFGIAGLIAAPICYAWLKDELSSRDLI